MLRSFSILLDIWKPGFRAPKLCQNLIVFTQKKKKINKLQFISTMGNEEETGKAEKRKKTNEDKLQNSFQYVNVF